MLFTLLDFISSVSLFIIFTDLLMMFGFHFWWLYAAKTWHYHPKAIQNKYLFKKKIIKENCIYTFAPVAMNILSMSHAFHLIIILHVSISHHLSKIGHPGECEPAYNRPSPPPSAK